MQITWKILGLEREVLTGIVRRASWVVTAEHKSLSSSNNGHTGFYAEIAGIPYEDLTEEVVLNWVWSSLGADKARIETTISRLAEDREIAEITRGLPWSTE
jgi:hypothetical protein